MGRILRVLAVLAIIHSSNVLAQPLERQTFKDASGQVIGSSTSFQGHSTYFGSNGQYIGESTSSSAPPIGAQGYGTPTRPDDGYQVPNMGYKGSSSYGDYLFEQLIFGK